jgi:hypothetical protein
MLLAILIVLLLFFVCGGVGGYAYNRSDIGHGGMSIGGVIFVILIVLLLMG